MAFKGKFCLKKVFFVVFVWTLAALLIKMTMLDSLIWYHSPVGVLEPASLHQENQVFNQDKIQAKNLALNLTDMSELDGLLQILQTRLQNYSGPMLHWKDRRCTNKTTGATSCYDTACPGHFSPSLRERLQQVLSVRAPIPARYLEALASAARPVTPHKYIFVTGTSSNHYQEMQALLNSSFESLFPRMKGENYTFVVYNLGLTTEQRKKTEKHCRCTLIDFPFSGLPEFVKFLNCYVWKPLIIASLLEKAEYLVWMDASIRWKKSTPLAEMFSRAKSIGYQTRHNTGPIAVRSQASMAQFFGDHLCQYSPFTEMETGLGFYYNDRFMREAILKPWLSCAFNTDCMCIKDSARLRNCRRRGKTRYGVCHRFEQSSIGMIFSKLFLDKRPMLYLRHNAVRVARNQKMNWFESSTDYVE
ncbi:uncharacterized protein LOC143274848 [Babylonia areolata]|uniref:uncharacterized protein LOC143274848 n=1 Tax=Babylonia areolata TaxID=304850 RepID=UPI003FCFBEF4